jgi:hypothetical protein
MRIVVDWFPLSFLYIFIVVIVGGVEKWIESQKALQQSESPKNPGGKFGERRGKMSNNTPRRKRELGKKRIIPTFSTGLSPNC